MYPSPLYFNQAHLLLLSILENADPAIFAWAAAETPSTEADLCAIWDRIFTAHPELVHHREAAVNCSFAHLAAELYLPEMMELLARHHVDFSAVNDLGQTVIHRIGHIGTISARNPRDPHGPPIRLPHPNILRYIAAMITHGANPAAQDEDGNTLLHCLATAQRDPAGYRSLIEEELPYLLGPQWGLDIHHRNHHGNTALDCILDTVSKIHRSMPELSRTVPRNALLEPVQGLEQLAQALWGARISPKMREAIQRGNIDVLEPVLHSPVATQWVDENGLNLLDLAILAQQPHLVRMLARSGLSPHTTNPSGQSLVVETIVHLESALDGTQRRA